MTDQTDMKERLDHFRIDQDVLAGLDAYRPHLAVAMDHALDVFYEHALGTPELAAFFTDKSRVSQIKAKQGDHWGLLFSGKFDDAYYQSALVVARVHNRIGLRPLYYMAGYNIVIEQLFSVAVDAFKKKPDTLKKVLRAINTVVMLDTNLVLKVYQDNIKHKAEETLSDTSDKFDHSVGAGLEGVSSIIGEIEQMADDLAKIAASTGDKCISVSAATEEASANVQTVATASEQLDESIKEISRQIQAASALSDDAVTVTQEASQQLGKLEESSRSIGEVTRLIMDIAAQTNMLALNATIEAARAGEAGKGFAVVASEVKSLSNRTEEATRGIQEQVSAITSVTATTVDAVENVVKKINEISHAVSTVAAASEEQAAATEEITRSVSEASAGTREVAENMESVRVDASETGEASNNLSQRVANLQSQSAQLLEMSKDFTDSVRTMRID